MVPRGQQTERAGKTSNIMAHFLPICQSADISLSILVVSDNGDYLKRLSAGLEQTNTGNGDFLKVYSCEAVSQVLKVTEPPQVDFVVFYVNQKRFEAINEIEQSILKLDKGFILGRICLVCDNTEIQGSFMPKILHLKHKYQLHVLWGDFKKEIPNLCKRLVNLASAVCGAVSGFPIITHRSWHGRDATTGDFSSVRSDDMTF